MKDYEEIIDGLLHDKFEKKVSRGEVLQWLRLNAYAIKEYYDFVNEIEDVRDYLKKKGVKFDEEKITNIALNYHNGLLDSEDDTWFYILQYIVDDNMEEE